MSLEVVNEVNLNGIEVELFECRLYGVYNALQNRNCSITDKQGINNEVYSFLSSQISVENVIKRLPVLGHLLCCLTEDEEFVLQHNVGRTIIGNMMWFIRIDSTNPFEMQTTDWAQTIFRRLFSYCARNHSSLFYDCQWTKKEESKTLEQYILLLKNSFHYFTEHGETLDTVCCISYSLIKHNRISNEKIESLLRLLPISADSRFPVQQLFKVLSDYLVFVDGVEELKKCVAERYRPFFELILLKQLSLWLTSDDPIQRNHWLFKLMSEDKRCFQLGMTILHSLYMELNCSLLMECYIGNVMRIIRSFKSEVFDLYPKRLTGIVCLLEEPPSAKLAENVMMAVDSALDAHLICSEEFLMLTTHFQDWKSAIDDYLQQRPTITKMLQIYLKRIRP